MYRTMWDGIKSDAQKIAGVIRLGDLVAYYIDGENAWSAEDIALFPDNEHVTITILGNNADVADCENGLMTPAQAAEWIVRQKADGYDRPSVYRSLAVMPDLRNATGSLVMGKDWDAWVAHYDGKETEDYPGEAAKQYRNAAYYDVSEVYDEAWPHRKTALPVTTETNYVWPAGIELHKSNVGKAVQALQQALRGSEIPGVRGIAVNGVFGQQTLTAVRNFQASQKIDVDGIAGDQTRNALIAIGRLNSAGQAPN